MLDFPPCKSSSEPRVLGNEGTESGRLSRLTQLQSQHKNWRLCHDLLCNTQEQESKKRQTFAGNGSTLRRASRTRSANQSSPYCYTELKTSLFRCQGKLGGSSPAEAAKDRNCAARRERCGAETYRFASSWIPRNLKRRKRRRESSRRQIRKRGISRFHQMWSFSCKVAVRVCLHLGIVWPTKKEGVLPSWRMFCLVLQSSCDVWSDLCEGGH